MQKHEAYQQKLNEELESAIQSYKLQQTQSELQIRSPAQVA